MSDAETITRSLNGRWLLRYGVAPCPVCQPEGRPDQTALTITDGEDGRLLLHCKRAGCAFRDLLAACGLSREEWSPPDPSILAMRRAERLRMEVKREAQARRCWDEAKPIVGTVAETYLRGRAITCPLPPTLRFHPACWHPTARRLPAMVALVEGADGFGVLRTYLHPGGAGKTDTEPQRAMLGSCAGGAVTLSVGEGPLVVAEGIETALSVASGLLEGPATTWAALSTSGMAALCLPSGPPDRLIIATDGDDAGKAAGCKLAERAYSLGWTVSLLPAPDGRDWNDILKENWAA